VIRMTVSLRGEPLFEYEGDAAELAKLTETHEDLAAGIGLSAMTVASRVLQIVDKQGLPKKDPERRGMMTWITYLLLHTDTHHPGYPGKYIDYAVAWDFEFNLLPSADGKSVDIEVVGDPFTSPT
jgi:hypothetical protein